MSGEFHVYVTAIIEINASNYAYFDTLRLCNGGPFETQSYL